MNITIFGGTGKTGLMVLEKALAAEHQVTAYARNPSKISIRHQNLIVVQGELTEQSKIEDAVKGADVVLSLLGPTGYSSKLPISNGIRNIISAMQKNGVRRLVAAVSSSYRDPQDKFNLWVDFGVFVLKIIGRSILKDIEETGRIIAESPLDWTMIRLPKLSNQAAKNQVDVGYTGDGKVSCFLLSRADLAEFLFKQIDDKTYLRQAPIISN